MTQLLGHGMEGRLPCCSGFLGTAESQALRHDYCVWETAVTASECWSKGWLSSAFLQGWVEVPFSVAPLRELIFTKLISSKLAGHKAESPIRVWEWVLQTLLYARYPKIILGGGNTKRCIKASFPNFSAKIRISDSLMWKGMVYFLCNEMSRTKDSEEGWSAWEKFLDEVL